MLLLEHFNIIDIEQLSKFIEKDNNFKNIYTFEELELAAKTAHSVVQCVNRKFGCKELPAWEQTLTWYRASMVKHVEYIVYHNYKPSKIHDKWVKRKIGLGWKYGLVLDKDKKTHPLLISYTGLPVEERMKLDMIKAAVMPFRKIDKNGDLK